MRHSSNLQKVLSFLCVLMALLFSIQAVQAAWATLLVVDSTGSVGQYCSLAEVNGRPAISYYDATNGDLLFIRATDATGAAWPLSAQKLDQTGTVGQYTSLAMIGGFPAIGYVNFDSGQLKFIRALDASGTSWDIPVVVDDGVVGPGTGINAQYVSLAEVDGFPAMAYFDAQSGGALRYVRATNVAGTSWSSPLVIDEILPDMTGMTPSLKVVGGNPAVAYYDATNTNLKFFRASDITGATWSAANIKTVGTVAQDVGTMPALLVVNGNPAISYTNFSNGNLEYIRAADVNGDNWSAAAVAADPGGSNYLYASMVVTGGNPAVAYLDSTNSTLKYVRADDSNGSAWIASGPHVLDSGAVGEYASMAVIDGLPAVAYYDGELNQLKYTRAYSATAVTLNNLQAHSLPAAGAWGGLALLALSAGLLLRLRKTQ